jgi:hypothetical protein
MLGFVPAPSPPGEKSVHDRHLQVTPPSALLPMPCRRSTATSRRMRHCTATPLYGLSLRQRPLPPVSIAGERRRRSSAGTAGSRP